MAVKALIDTSIWLNLAKDYRLKPVLTALQDLIEDDEISLIMPQIILDEFERNRDRVVADAKRSLSGHFKRVWEAIAQFGDEEKRSETIDQLNEVDHKMAMSGEASQHTLKTIAAIMATSPAIEAGDSIKLRAIDRAVAKKAPFHHGKNSVNDALLVEIYAEALDADKDSNFAFLTENTRDFSQHNGDQRLPHADLASLFEGRSTYATSIVDFIRSIDFAMLEEYEWEHSFHVQPRKLSELVEAEKLLFRQVWYNRHWNSRNNIEAGKVRLISREEFDRLKGFQPDIVVDEVWETALVAAKKTEEEVGIDNLGPWDDFEWGMINGKLSALRWVLGDEWDMLDT